MENSYNFPVELQPIYLSNGMQVKGRRAVVRTDTMNTLGIVSEGYKLVPHNTVVEAFREVGQKYNVEEIASVANNGAYLYYKMAFPKVEMEVRKNDIVRMTMIVRNSYNGKNSLQVILGAVRLVCLNGMVIGTRFMQFAYRHFGSADKIDFEQYRKAFQHHIKLFGTHSPQIVEMARLPVPANNKLFDIETVRMPKYLLNEAQEKFETENDHTVWGYYNSLTFAVTHKMRKQNPNSSTWLSMQAWKAAEQLLKHS